MDDVAEDLAQADADAELTVLTPEEITGQNLDASDEVENLRNSLREAVHDDNVRPKMQCLMMDSSFSMVTMQGEDSGIAWETTPSRCNTPWASEAGSPTVDLGSPIPVWPAKPGSVPAGKIIFVMDEELMSRRKKTKERVSSQKRQQEVLAESSDNIPGRPELVEVSEPNVKIEEGAEEELTDPLVDKEQRLFRLVSEGSEILNIVVPPKLVTVDEEESKEMVDNLSYLEDSHVCKAGEGTNDNELLIAPTVSVAGDEQIQSLLPIDLHVTDPPGAPVARPLGRVQAPKNMDYFEAFTLIDAQAPGSPAVLAQEQAEPEAEDAAKIQDTEKPVESNDTTTSTTVDNDNADTVSLGEITSELLDEVFYGGTDDYVMKNEAKGGEAEGAPTRLPSKPSGSNLFGSQEHILTPIFLPEGPPKIIDPILLEEPKAMAFLYTDLYEEAIGSRQKEEDAESMTSEKSFHSRHSDREARGYLEKYVLIDETPTLGVDPADKEKAPQEGPRTLTQDLYDFHFMSKPEKAEMPNSEEEITDFFRSSANSSPCDVEPFPRSLEEDDAQPVVKKEKAKTNKTVPIALEKVVETTEDPLTMSSFDFPLEEDWGSTGDHPTAVDNKDISMHSDQNLCKQDLAMQKPVAPPRKKATSPPKTCLDLTPLTPVEVIMQEKEEAGGKEQRVEEKETASPAETADEGDGDGEETAQSSSKASAANNALAPQETEPPQTESVKESSEITVDAKDTKAAEEEGRSETDTKQTEPEEANIKSSESAEAVVDSDKQGKSAAAVPTEPAKQKGQCIIL